MYRLLCSISDHFAALKKEQGATLAYFAVSMTVLLGIAALVLDMGIGLLERRQMQNAADAAALAGARMLALGGSNSLVQSEVNRLAGANGAPATSWNFISSGTGVRVRTDTSFNTWFARIFGLNTIDTGATSEAHIGAVAETGNLLPMTTMCQPFTFGSTYHMWDKDKEAPGNFGWVDWDGVPVSNTDLVANLTNPSRSGHWAIGDWMPGGPGVKNSSGVLNALNGWLGKHVTIPLYDTVTGNGSHTRYRICGFAEFVLTDYSFKGNNKYVDGYFVRHIEPDAVIGNVTDYGLTSVRITR